MYMPSLALLNSLGILGALAALFGLLIIFVFVITFVKCFRKVEQGTALVRTGVTLRGSSGVKVSFSGTLVWPVFHREEIMDISVKRIEIYRHGSEGLICKDNVRADIKVAFFVRVNNSAKDVLQVAQSIGCKRASDQAALIELFDAKFSEALKTVGKKFDFTDLYTEREKFKEEILAHLGTDLNGYVLDDAAIDYLEQTDVTKLDPSNILDAEGIKKITDLTAREQVFANDINREKEKTITKQDVEAREAILELEKQQAEAEQRQKREIAEITVREQAQADKAREEEKLKSERARISTEEELGVQEENKLRQVIVAEQSKLRTHAVEQERVQRERDLEATERERVVELARIEKEKALEVERKKIQDVIRERVIVERAVVEEQERIKDTEELAAATRAKGVQVTAAEALAEEALIKEVKAAEAGKTAAKFQADEVLIEAEAQRQAAEKEALGKMKLAEAVQAETAASGLAEAEVMDAKAGAVRNYGTAEAEVTARKGEAEADVIAKRGEAEAGALNQHYSAEAEGVAAKAEAMKKLDGVGKEHEEFKLHLDKEKAVELAEIEIKAKIAAEQAAVLAEALKQANIDIVGGDGQFFDRIINSITSGKQVDRMVGNSEVLSDIKSTFFNGSPEYFQRKVRQFVGQFGIDAEDAKNLTVAALVTRMISLSSDDMLKSELQNLLGAAKSAGLADKKVGKLGLLDGAK